MTPGALAPASNSDNQALVAVGIPAGAKAGTYDVTLTARLANGQTRTRIGKLTVTGGGGGTTGGSTKLKLTTLLPKGLSVVDGAQVGHRRPHRREQDRHRPRPALPGNRQEEQEAEGDQERAAEGARAPPGSC